MAQITSGIKSILSKPLIYNVLQNVLISKASRSDFIAKYFKPETEQRWLDIGCGTAELLELLPEGIHYLGFDGSKEYIDYASDKYKERDAEFFMEILTDRTLLELGKFDRVVATGLLHHIDDAEVINLFNIIKPVLDVGGRFITIDPCYVPNQSLISKALVKRDRGQNVRGMDEYYNLAVNIFDDVELIHRNDMLRLPYDHTILICK